MNKPLSGRLEVGAVIGAMNKPLSNSLVGADEEAEAGEKLKLGDIGEAANGFRFN